MYNDKYTYCVYVAGDIQEKHIKYKPFSSTQSPYKFIPMALWMCLLLDSEKVMALWHWQIWMNDSSDRVSCLGILNWIFQYMKFLGGDVWVRMRKVYTYTWKICIYTWCWGIRTPAPLTTRCSHMCFFVGEFHKHKKTCENTRKSSAVGNNNVCIQDWPWQNLQ